MKAGYGKAGKQKTLSNFPTATTTTNYNYLWDTDSEGKVTMRSSTRPSTGSTFPYPHKNYEYVLREAVNSAFPEKRRFCRKRRQRRLRGHRETIAERFERDRAALLPLPAAPYEACGKITTRVTSLSLVRYRSNDYSVPTEYGHRQVLVKGYVHHVVIVCGSEVIARHERSYERESAVFDPLHYLRLLEHKSRALEQAAPLASWQLPDCFGHLRRLLEARLKKHGRRGVYPGASAAGDLRSQRSIHRCRRRTAHEHHQLRCRAPSGALRIERRPPRLDLQNWPHLPLPRVRITAAADYMTLLAATPTSPSPSNMEVV